MENNYECSFFDGNKTIDIKGKMYFVLTDKGLDILVYEAKKEYNENNTLDVGYTEEINGEEFLECVLCHGFIDYDGFIAQVTVDDYESNLGLAAVDDADLIQGKFLVTPEVWRDICKAHKVVVYWANR